MNGYVYATSACTACKRLMTYNPHLVPSLRINGTRQPVCRPCVEHANVQREEMGLELFTILPGAYEPMREEEL